MNGLLFGAILLGSTMQAPASTAQQAGSDTVFEREDVLGTSLRLVLVGHPEAAQDIESAVLGEIERLRTILSSWDATSELRRLPLGEPVAASDELRKLLDECNDWSKRTKGAFHPGVAAYAELWEKAVASGSEPTDAELAAVKKRLKLPLFKVDNFDERAARLVDVPVNLDGVAKGYILDLGARKAIKAGASGGLLDIGGDLIAFGDAEQVVAIADPAHPADNAAPLEHVHLKAAAIATSGGYARGYDIGGKHYSHILDPSTGRPVEHVLQATVVAKTALEADLLATAFNVLDPRDSVRLCARIKGAETLILTAGGGRYQSTGWHDLEVIKEGQDAPAHSALPGGGEVQIALQLAAIGRSQEGGERREGGYKRPYVAVWIEDSSGSPVRTLSLWIERDRWIDDLRQWARLFDHKSAIVAAVTRATRGPGEYKLAFDGLDKDGKALPAGTYSLLIEATREHGTYQLQKQELILDGRAFHFVLEAGTELGQATIDYHPKVAK